MKQNILKCVLRTFLFAFIFTFSPQPTEAAEIPQPTLGDDGLYRQPWFLESFLDIKEDMETAKANGKRLVVFIEQKGCIYCKKVQTEILVDPRINAYVRKHFEVLQIDLWGHKEVTDLDGEVTTERKVSRKWRSMFTPTIVFLPESVEKAKGKSGGDAAVAIMPGAFGKGTFLALFEWVHNKGYEKGEHFQKYVNDRYWKKKGGRPKR
jgi:thioredoxin-related protein